MEIKKVLNEFIDQEYDGYDIYIADGNKRLSFSQGGSDPHIEFRYINLDDITFPVEFDIFKEYGKIYELSNKLYENIKNCNLFWEESSNTQNKLLKKLPQYNQIFHDGIVEYIGDGTPNDLVRIIKKENRITYHFDRKKDNDNYQTPYMISIRIRQSGSRYDPFHIPFHFFYKELQNIEEIKIYKPKILIHNN